MQTEIRSPDGGLLLQPYWLVNADAVYRAVRESLPQLLPWMPWCHAEYSRDDTETWLRSQPQEWESARNYNFAITSAEGESFLGACGINSFNHQDQFASLGYWVRSTRTGGGIATTAARCLARAAFEALPLNRIEIVVAVENVASRRVAEKIGGTFEGVLRSRTVVRDRVLDAAMYSLIPDDFQ